MKGFKSSLLVKSIQILVSATFLVTFVLSDYSYARRVSVDEIRQGMGSRYRFDVKTGRWHDLKKEYQIVGVDGTWEEREALKKEFLGEEYFNTIWGSLEIPVVEGARIDISNIPLPPLVIRPWVPLPEVKPAPPPAITDAQSVSGQIDWGWEEPDWLDWEKLIPPAEIRGLGDPEYNSIVQHARQWYDTVYGELKGNGKKIWNSASLQGRTVISKAEEEANLIMETARAGADGILATARQESDNIEKVASSQIERLKNQRDSYISDIENMRQSSLQEASDYRDQAQRMEGEIRNTLSNEIDQMNSQRERIKNEMETERQEVLREKAFYETERDRMENLMRAALEEEANRLENHRGEVRQAIQERIDHARMEEGLYTREKDRMVNDIRTNLDNEASRLEAHRNMLTMILGMKELEMRMLAFDVQSRGNRAASNVNNFVDGKIQQLENNRQGFLNRLTGKQSDLQNELNTYQSKANGVSGEIWGAEGVGEAKLNGQRQQELAPIHCGNPAYRHYYTCGCWACRTCSYCLSGKVAADRNRVNRKYDAKIAALRASASGVIPQYQSKYQELANGSQEDLNNINTAINEVNNFYDRAINEVNNARNEFMNGSSEGAGLLENIQSLVKGANTLADNTRDVKNDVQTKYTEAITDMRTQIEDVITQIGENMDSLIQSAQESADAFTEARDELDNSYGEAINDLRTSIEEAITSIVDNFNTLIDAAQETADMIQDAEEQIDSQYQEQIDSLVQATEENINVLNEQMEELAKSAEETASDLWDLMEEIDSNYREQIETLMSMVEETVSDLMTQAREQAEELLKQGSERAEEIMEQAHAQANMILDYAEERISALYKSQKDYTVSMFNEIYARALKAVDVSALKDVKSTLSTEGKVVQGNMSLLEEGGYIGDITQYIDGFTGMGAHQLSLHLAEEAESVVGSGSRDAAQVASELMATASAANKDVSLVYPQEIGAYVPVNAQPSLPVDEGITPAPIIVDIQFKEYLKDTVEFIRANTDEINATLKQTREDVVKENKEWAGKVRDNIDDYAEEVAGNLQTMAEEYAQSVITSVNGILNSFKDSWGNVRVNITEIQDTRREMAQKVDEAKGEIMDSIRSASQELQNAFEGLKNEIITSVREQRDSMREAYDSLVDSSNKIIESTHEAADTIYNQIEEAKNKLITQALDMEQKRNEAYNKLVKATNDTIESIHKAGNEMVTKFNDFVFNQFLPEIDKYANDIRTGIQQVEEAAQKFIQQIGEFVDNMATDEVEKIVTDALNGVDERMQSRMDAFNGYNNALEEAKRRLRNAEGAVGPDWKEDNRGCLEKTWDTVSGWAQGAWNWIVEHKELVIGILLVVAAVALCVVTGGAAIPLVGLFIAHAAGTSMLAAAIMGTVAAALIVGGAIMIHGNIVREQLENDMGLSIEKMNQISEDYAADFENISDLNETVTGLEEDFVNAVKEELGVDLTEIPMDQWGDYIGQLDPDGAAYQLMQAYVKAAENYNLAVQELDAKLRAEGLEDGLQTYVHAFQVYVENVWIKTDTGEFRPNPAYWTARATYGAYLDGKGGFSGAFNKLGELIGGTAALIKDLFIAGVANWARAVGLPDWVSGSSWDALATEYNQRVMDQAFELRNDLGELSHIANGITLELQTGMREINSAVADFIRPVFGDWSDNVAGILTMPVSMGMTGLNMALSVPNMAYQISLGNWEAFGWSLVDFGYGALSAAAGLAKGVLWLGEKIFFFNQEISSGFSQMQTNIDNTLESWGGTILDNLATSLKKGVDSELARSLGYNAEQFAEYTAQAIHFGMQAAGAFAFYTVLALAGGALMSKIGGKIQSLAQSNSTSIWANAARRIVGAQSRFSGLASTSFKEMGSWGQRLMAMPVKAANGIMKFFVKFDDATETSLGLSSKWLAASGNWGKLLANNVMTRTLINTSMVFTTTYLYATDPTNPFYQMISNPVAFGVDTLFSPLAYQRDANGNYLLDADGNRIAKDGLLGNVLSQVVEFATSTDLGDQFEFLDLFMQSFRRGSVARFMPAIDIKSNPQLALQNMQAVNNILNNQAGEFITENGLKFLIDPKTLQTQEGMAKLYQITTNALRAQGMTDFQFNFSVEGMTNALKAATFNSALSNMSVGQVVDLMNNVFQGEHNLSKLNVPDMSFEIEGVGEVKLGNIINGIVNGKYNVNINNNIATINIDGMQLTINSTQLDAFNAVLNATEINNMLTYKDGQFSLKLNATMLQMAASKLASTHFDSLSKVLQSNNLAQVLNGQGVLGEQLELSKLSQEALKLVQNAALAQSASTLLTAMASPDTQVDLSNMDAGIRSQLINAVASQVKNSAVPLSENTFQIGEQVININNITNQNLRTEVATALQSNLESAILTGRAEILSQDTLKIDGNIIHLSEFENKSIKL